MLKFWDKNDLPSPGSFAGEQEWVTDLVRAIAISIANKYLRELEKRKLQEQIDEENAKKQKKIDYLKSKPASNKLHRRGTILDRLSDKTVTLDTKQIKSNEYQFFTNFKGIIDSVTLTHDGDVEFDLPGYFDLGDGFIENCIQEGLVNWEMAYDYTQQVWEENDGEGEGEVNNG